MKIYRYYNSDMDFKVDIAQMTNSICNVANSTANAIYNQASNGNGTQLVSANCTLISSLLDCLVSNFSCSFMQTYFNGKIFDSVNSLHNTHQSGSFGSREHQSLLFCLFF